MKAWQVHQFGEPEEMSFADAPLPEPGPGEVLIRNHAAGVNFFDILMIQGKYQSRPGFPFTPGGEVAGVVEKTGEGVESLRRGDPVLAHTQGGYAGYSVARESRVAPLPPRMTFEEAAAFPIVYQTSWFALDHRARLQPGEWVLVHAGASGVGSSAIQIAKVKGASVIATAGSDAKLEFCRNQGADHVLGYQDSGWVDEVKRLTAGRGADVIYDPVGGDVFDLSTKCIAPGGRLLVIGFASGRIPSIQLNRVLLKNIAITGVFWGRHLDENPTYFRQAHGALTQLYEEGKIGPRVSRRYPLGQAPRALEDIARRRIVGKAVLTIAE